MTTNACPGLLRRGQLRGAGCQQGHGLTHIPPGCGRAYPEPGRQPGERLALAQVRQDQQRLLPGVALKASTGAKLWSFPAGGGISSSPAVANGVVYIGGGDTSVYALNAATGPNCGASPPGTSSTPRLRWPTGWSTSAPTMATCMSSERLPGRNPGGLPPQPSLASRPRWRTGSSTQALKMATCTPLAFAEGRRPSTGQPPGSFTLTTRCARRTATDPNQT